LSYFPCFPARLDAIAGEAELNEKSTSDLKRIADLVRTRCEEAMKEHEEKKDEENNGEGLCSF
jgi:chromodomain-helicase-DNA-binding protein 1